VDGQWFFNNLLGHSRQQVRHWGIVAKRFADVNVKVNVAGREDEASSQLEGVFPQLVLPVARSLCAGPRHAVIVPQEVQQRTDSKVDGAIRNSIRIDQEREVDARVFPEQASVLHVAQSNRSNPGALELESFFSFAQLRDMLAAEYSTVVPEKRDYAGCASPQGAQTNLLPVAVR
jgi:hypothetical protein